MSVELEVYEREINLALDQSVRCFVNGSLLEGQGHSHRAYVIAIQMGVLLGESPRDIFEARREDAIERNDEIIRAYALAQRKEES